MKKLLAVISIIIFVFITVLFSTSNYSILRVKDLLTAIKSSRTSKITIIGNNEQYYNRWQCFSVETVEITEAEVNYNGWHKVPSINVKTKNIVKSFDLDPDVRWDNDKIIKKWRDLIKDQKSICIFGVFLQKEEDGSSLWYIQKIKTKKGYWDRLKLVTY